MRKLFSAQRSRAALILIGICIIGGILLYVVLPRAKETDNSNPSRDVVRHTTDSPSEQPVSQQYSADYGEPLSIEIKTTGIKGFIQKVGVDQKQAVTAPDNIHLAGWFIDSVKPGEKGLSIIDGHEGGSTTDGIFKKLPGVKSGDIITVTMGGGQTHTYEVFATKTIPNAQSASALFEQDPSVKSQLNLITCTGQYNDSARTYEDRFIVYARLMDAPSD